MQDKVKHAVHGDTITLQVLTNRFTHDLVTVLKAEYPLSELSPYKIVEFDLNGVNMIDSSSIGFLFDLHNKLKGNDKDSKLVINVANNKDLKDLLHKFQVDLLLNVK